MSGTGVWVSTLYGGFSLRCFLGDELGDIVLGGHNIRQWNLSALVNAPFIPIALILSGTHFFKSLSVVMPFYLSPPALFHGTPFFTDTMMFPPSPPVLFACLPIAQFFYGLGKRSLARWLVNRSSPAISELRQAQGDVGPRLANVAEDRDALEIEYDVNERLAAMVDGGEPTTLSVDSLARLFIGGLMLPPIAKLMGSALYGLSSYSSALRTFLGIHPIIYRHLDWPFGIGRVLLPKTRYRDFDPIWYACVGNILP